MEPPIKFTPSYTPPEKPAGPTGMVVDFASVPEGWWLHGMHHNHTPIRVLGDVHEPTSLEEHGMPPWTVTLQRRRGGHLVEASALTPNNALLRAIMAAELADDEEGGER